ncbi:non-ribosomal peptide synthetase [Clostridium sp. UBA4548]|uniref:non-ribosomal peptide synthetase n=1 Tax=Clostridium sp. UBA4548 TaxID=1946361 RepID=UPI0025C02011|nr:non-ribosomal peptide synthetase [Clostridium sp. UBA4548]
MAKIWTEILGIEKVGINDNFFDLGGHSLKATMIISKIHKELNKEIPLKELFKSPTIKELGKYIESAEENLYSKIEKVEEKEYYEASSAQKRMYMLQQFDKDITAYNMPAVFELEGKVDKNKIEETFRKLTQRHEALRTYFETLDGEIVQKIQSNYEFELVKKQNENIEDIIKSFVKPFNLEKAPLLRLELIENKEKTYLLIDMHHIISDGLSMEILINEFSEIYSGKTLEPLKLQYKDFAAWQNNFLKSEEMKKQEEYWVNRFSDEIPVLNMPTDYERPAMQSFEGDSVSFEVDEDTTLKLRNLTKETGTTMHMALLSAFNILLSKYSGQEDIVIGTPIAGRPHADLQNIMGMFVNTLALRNKPEGNKKYIDFLKEVKENSLKAYENQSYQLEALVGKLDVRRDTSRNPLFDVMFNMVDTVTSEDIKLNDIILKQYNNKNKVSKFDLTLNALEIDEKLSFTIEYCSKLFKKETIERISSHYVKILDDIVGNKEIKLCEVDLLSEAERNKILYEFNDTKADYPKDKTIHELFEEQVQKTPDNIALVFEENRLTYRELNERANSLARLLRMKGVKADSIVGIMVERSLEMIVGIMGILKAGGAYLPIDPNYPKERIEYMLKDSESKILLSESTLVETLEFDGESINLYDETLFNKSSSNLEKINECSNLAYVIYTSGTTGNPKGVMIEHRTLNNYIEYAKVNYFIEENMHMPLYTSISFDLTVTSIFTPLISGGSIIIYENLEIDKLTKKVFGGERQSVIKVTPAHLSLLIEMKDVNRSINRLIVGGEDLAEKLSKSVSELFDNKVDIINEYGPTEATVGCIVHKYNCKNNYRNSVLIGKPINNTQIYIVDSNIKLLPIGVSGEIYISGEGLARGYLNKPELTAEKFVDNPFEPGTKMYKTGDLARWLPDGNIEFLGRIDNQVKIRGFRIELGEIENRLLQHENIKEAAVLVKENKDSEKYICAYVVSDKTIQQLNLKGHLRETLPEYMVPAYFVKLEKMPLTTNGKLDRRALPEPNLDASLTEYETPRNEVEKALAKIWTEILAIERVGINDNFFDLGGHSLKATMLIAKIHKELSKEVPLKELFKSPTIKGISKYLESAEENLYSKIEKVEEKEYYEASSAQKRMYMLQQFDKDSIAYNMPAVFELEGKVDKNKIEETFRKLTERHEALRTYFETLDGEIVQKIQSNYEFELVKKQNESIEDTIKSFVRVFDLEKAPLLRVELVENKEKTYLLVDMHHIISDGLSMSILINEFSENYSGKILEPLKLQYKDFAAWQNSFLKSEEMKKQEEYWINRFSDQIPILNMPTDYERPAMQSFEGESVSFEVDENTTLKLRNLIKETGTTMHMALLSTFNILLSKYSGQEDIVIGTPVAGRPHADLQNIMGVFVNTLALRNKPEGNKKYIDFLKEVKENSLKAYENQSYQLETLVEKLDVRRDTSRNPLFDVMFNMVDTVTSEDIKLNDIILKQYSNKNKVAKFDLTLNTLEIDEKLSFTMDYCSKLFKKETIERLSSHYIRVLDSIVNNVQIKLSEIDLLSEADKNQILYEFNDTKADYPKDKTIHELFEEQVDKTPDNIAVVFEDKKLTYKELNERANSLARVLRNKGVKADSIVGIMVERSLEMIVGIIGILKSGGAYLPIDPNYPKERIEYMLKDSGSKVLLSKSGLVEPIEFGGEVIDLYDENLPNEHSVNLEKINDSSNLAYIIYTSGTTGNPKGAMIEHKSLVNRLNWMQKKYPITEKDTILQKTTYTFDVSVWEILWWSLVGAKVCMLTPNAEKDPMKIIETIDKYEVTTMHFVPSMLDVFLYCVGENNNNINLSSLRQVFSSGEALNFKQVSKFYKEFEVGKKLINLYGPTEATIDVSYFDCVNDGKKAIPIGKPIDNTGLYILNNNDVAPIGVAGELYIGGHGLARGYVNRQELTAEKFVDNPFDPGTKIYKTGDLARWLPDGNIEFLGRIDNQVKVRGFRIELGEIESRLLQHENIKEAAVLVKENKDSEKYICAYIVSDKRLKELDLKGYLKETLPEYMVPAYFVELEKMPLTTNGKLDRRALPEPNLDAALTEYEAPRNEVEKALVKIWTEILAVEGVGINDNFFDLGGHSLKATMLMAKIHKELNKEVPLKELFKSPTIKGISKYIESAEENLYSKIEKVEEKEYYEASSAQKRMYMLQKFDKDSIAYNMSAVFELEGKVDKNKIEETFRKLIQRHEALRTYFKTLDGEIIQRLQNDYVFELKYKNENRNIEDIINSFVRPFNLEKAPLLRVELVENKEKTHLLIDMHHIISDGLSMEILINEFSEIYSGKILEPLKLQYKDFAAWQNNFLKSEKMKKQEKYWINRFSDEIPVLNMPTDYERPAMQSFEGDSVSFQVDGKITENLRKLTKETGTTLHMVLLSAFNILLSKYSGQEDLVIGTPIAGRPHADLQNIMGMFVNTLALRNKPEGNKKYIDFLKEVKENTLKAYENQSYQLETLVEKLDVRRDTSRNPLFDVMFNSINLFNKDKKIIECLLIKSYDMKVKTSKADLELTVQERLETIQLELTYCTNLYNRNTIEIKMEDYINILEIIVTNKEMSIDNIILKCSERGFDYNSDLDILEEQFNI